MLAATTVCARPAPEKSSSPPTREGFTVTPFVALAATYDDNLFGAAGAGEGDTILSVGPGLDLRYLSPRTEFHFSYSLAAAKYLHHSGLDSWIEEQQGTLGIERKFTDRLGAGIDASYLETHDPERLTPTTGLVYGRTRATEETLRPSFAYALDPRSTLAGGYEFDRQDLSGGSRTDIKTATFGYTHDLDPRSSIKLQFQNIAYDFSVGEDSTSDVLMLGWTHALSAQTTLVLSAGPRDTEGRMVPEILASITRNSEPLSWSLAYRRSQITVLGETGVVDVQGIDATLSFQPMPRLRFELSPGYYHDDGPGLNADIYHLGAYVSYALSPAWSLGLRDDYAHQRGAVGAAGEPVIRRNVVALVLRWGLPAPGDSYARAAAPVPPGAE